MRAQIRLRLGLFLLLLITLFYVCIFCFSSYTPSTTDLKHTNQPPSFTHLFGTDDLGRDILVRTAEGVCISILIGILAFGVDLFIGASVGMCSALLPSTGETFFLRAIEIVYSLPYLLVVILISVYTGSGLIPIIAAILCIGWINMAKVAHQLTKSCLVEGWAEAACAIGVSKKRLLVSHILPNTIQTLFATALLGIPYAIFTEAFLSFLGVGIQPPHASLGSMVSDALPAMRYYSWRLIFPATTIALLILSVTLIQEALRDLFDPHISKRKSKTPTLKETPDELHTPA